MAVLVWYCNYTNFLHRNDEVSSFRQCGRMVSYLYCITYLVSSFGGCMAQASHFDTARRPVSFLAKKARFVTTSNLRSCHKAANQWFETRGEPARTLNQSEMSPWSCILCLPHYLKSLSQYQPFGTLNPWPKRKTCDTLGARGKLLLSPDAPSDMTDVVYSHGGWSYIG